MLKSEHYDKTLITLENESGLNLHNFKKEILFLRKLILDGQWMDAEEFIKPLKGHPGFEYDASIFEIRKQKFLEIVEQEPDDSNHVEDLVGLLKDLQSKCPASVFNQLMFCLSSPSITDHSDYKNWTPLSGRLKCFDKLREYLKLIYPEDNEEKKIQPGSFLNLIKTLLVNFIQDDKNMKSIENLEISMSLFDKNLINSKMTNTVSIINDIKGKQKFLKDDNELYIKNNSELKAIRNAKVSQSLNANKISDLNDVTNDDIDKNKESYLPNRYDIYKLDNNDHIQSENVNISKRFNNKIEVGNTILNNNKNELADLDKEEYYMKTGYDFYEYVICYFNEGYNNISGNRNY